MTNITDQQASTNQTVIPFYATAALFFLGMSLMLFTASEELTGHHFTPSILAIVHTLVLGWATMLIFGAVYQLLPVLCEGELYSPKIAFASYILLLTGTIPLVFCFWNFQMGLLMILSGCAVVLAACLYMFNCCATVLKAPKSTIYQYFIIGSAIWLFLTTIAGLLLAINLTYTFIPRNHLELLKLHAHAGIVGWFLLLICGVTAKLVPMFLLGRCKTTRLLYIALILQNTGLFLFLVHGYFRHIDTLALGYGGIILLGTLFWGVFIYIAIKNRIRRKIDVLMKQSIISLLIQPIAIIALTIALFSTGNTWINIYGVFVFLGWITGLIISKTFKTLPFIVWNSLYKDIHGNARIPLPKNLYSEDLIRYQTLLFFTALLVLAAALIINQVWLLKTATFLWILLALLYCYNVAKVLFHKPQIHHEDRTQ